MCENKIVIGNSCLEEKDTLSSVVYSTRASSSLEESNETDGFNSIPAVVTFPSVFTNC